VKKKITVVVLLVLLLVVIGIGTVVAQKTVPVFNCVGLIDASGEYHHPILAWDSTESAVAEILGVSLDKPTRINPAQEGGWPNDWHEFDIPSAGRVALGGEQFRGTLEVEFYENELKNILYHFEYESKSELDHAYSVMQDALIELYGEPTRVSTSETTLPQLVNVHYVSTRWESPTAESRIELIRTGKEEGEVVLALAGPLELLPSAE